MASQARRSLWVRWLVAGALVVVVAQVAVIYGVIHADHRGSLLTGTEPVAADASIATPSATPTPSASSTPSPTASPRPSAGTRPGIDTAGIDLQFAPRPDGSIDVTERIVLRHRVESVVVTPPDKHSAGSAFDRSRPAVVGLQVEVAGLPIDDLPQEITSAETVDLPSRSTELTLRYQLSGTLVRSLPSTTGRALAFVRPITAEVDASLPVHTHSVGIGTLNIDCQQLPLSQQACARGSSPTLETSGNVTGKTSTVLVQLDIPDQ